MKGLLSDGKTLFLKNVNFHNSGSYSCEVVADSTFLTLIKSAHMQVVGKIISSQLSLIKIDRPVLCFAPSKNGTSVASLQQMVIWQAGQF